MARGLGKTGLLARRNFLRRQVGFEKTGPGTPGFRVLRHTAALIEWFSGPLCPFLRLVLLRLGVQVVS